MRDLKSLLPYARNARVHSKEQLEQIAASMLSFGWTNPVLLDDAGTIVAGHGRCLAAERIWADGKAIERVPKGKVPCVNLGPLSDAKRRAYILADNKIPQNASWDMELLRAELIALGQTDLDLALTGFTADEIAQAMIWAPPAAARSADPDTVPEVKGEPVTRPGDLWLLGPHRLFCGDSTKPEAVQAATAGALASCVWTDPPYNVAYEGVAVPRDAIANDEMGGLCHVPDGRVPRRIVLAGPWRGHLCGSWRCARPDLSGSLHGRRF